MFIQSGAWVITSRDRTMEKKWLKKIINLLRSLRFKIFISVFLLIMIPTIIVSIVLVNLSVDSYSDKKIERFKINNSMLKNSIVSEGYLEKNNQSKVIETQIAQLAGEHNCRVQIINSQYVIVEDTDNSAVGKTSVAENVIKAMEGKSIFINSKKGKYVEFAQPLIISVNVSNNIVNNKSSIIGVLYIRYSMEDVQSYRKTVDRFAAIADSLVAVFALIMAWICSVAFNRPIKEMYGSIKRITHGHTHDENKSKYPEITKITEDFSHYVDRMKAQNKTRQEFVSNVSHELKTPITSMKVLAESLIGNQGMPEELYQEFLGDICKEIDRENDIITDLLSLVKMEKPDVELNISTVNINEILETVLKRLKPIAENKNIELVFESFRPVIADVDEIKFASVATNLVENAIKYNNTDGTVTVSLNSDHQYFYLKVIDTGIGIAEEDQERVFERFFRVDKARARETGGTGLGLAITKDIVLKHHGSIKIHSKEGEGTTFIVRIPLKYIV